MKCRRHQTSFGNALILSLLVALCSSCYHYRVLNTVSDPSTEYHEAILHAYAWGLVNKPKDFVVPDCDNNGIDELWLSKSTGQSLFTWLTLGFVSTVKVRWKCHKPREPVDSL